MFTHLHVHSFYSLLSGASSPETLCAQAKSLGMTALALTDTNGLYGALRFLEAAKDNNIRPIFGAQITTSLPAQWGEPSVVVLAKDDKGFSELCQLISKRQLDKKFDLIHDCAACSQHAAIIASDLKLAQALKDQGKRHDLYLDVCDHSEYGDPGKNSLIIQQAAQAGIATVFTNAVWFANREDKVIHQACRAIHEHAHLRSLTKDECASEEAYLKSTIDMQQRFQTFSAVWERTSRLAEQCSGKPPIGRMHFPEYPFLNGSDEFTVLSELCFKGLRKRYQKVTTEALNQLALELSVIQEKQFSGYFLIVWDIAQEAKKRGIPTVGRGSAANSIVSYCLEITHVDPLAHGLFFERFLNPEREDPPDIDLDFPWDQRDEMLNYAYERFGKCHVAMVSTTNYLHARSAMREAGRVLGMTEGELSSFCKKLPHIGDMSDLPKVLERLPEARNLPVHEEPWKTIITLAEKLEGVPRHLSVHPGGILISPRPLAEVVPKEMSTKGLEVTQYDMYAAEDSGFVKIDLLGQRGLAVIRDVAREKQVDWQKVDPLNDEPTKKLMRYGQSMGCFYIESPAMRLLLKKLKCDDFELLTAASSVIRPGVSNSGMMTMFIERHLGNQPVTYAHPKMKAVLGDTYGVMVYQEDVIKVVHQLAGMSLGEADKLRRCMSKKRYWEKIGTYCKRFMQGATENGINQTAAEEIWRQIESFGGYAFCKAHSASYAQLSFQSAYLKAHYPAHFMAAVLTNQGGFYGASAYLEEARRMGLVIKGPDINTSYWRYTGEGTNLVVGLLAVGGLAKSEIEFIVRERQNHGQFRSMEDLLKRVDLLPEKADALIASGACDGLVNGRVKLRWQRLLASRQDKEEALMLPLQNLQELPDLQEPGKDEQLRESYDQMGLSPQAHPLMLYRNILSTLAGQRIIAANQLARYAGQHVKAYGWVVTSRRTKVKKSGEMMKFLTLEDFTASFEVTLFPKIYSREGIKLFGRGPYLVEGLVEDDRGGVTITAEKIVNLGQKT